MSAPEATSEPTLLPTSPDDGNSVMVVEPPPGAAGTQENPVAINEEDDSNVVVRASVEEGDSNAAEVVVEQPPAKSSTQTQEGASATGASQQQTKAGEGDDDEEPAQEEEEEASLNFRETDRFKRWRKHTRDLYQTMLHMETHWPSSCCQLLPYMSPAVASQGVVDANNAAVAAEVMNQTFICGTKTGDSEQNYLQLGTLSLPTSTKCLENCEFDADFGEIGGFEAAGSKAVNIKIERRFYHDGDVLAAKYMHSNPRIIATTSSNGNCYVFDPSSISLSAQPNKVPRPMVPLYPGEEEPDMMPEHRGKLIKKRQEYFKALKEQERWDQQRGASQHELLLKGNNGPAYTIDWNTAMDASLIAGSEGRVALWRVMSLSKSDGKEIEAHQTFDIQGEGNIVNDCKFQWRNPEVFAVATDAGHLLLGDARASEDSNGGGLSVLSTSAASATATSLNSLSFCPHNDNYLACGDANGSVLVYDIRNVGSGPIYNAQQHKAGTGVSQLQWCPHASSLLLSGGEDGFCAIVDTAKSAAESPLKFKHAGHTDVIFDASWSWQEQFAGLVLTADPNAIIAWRPRNKFW